MLAKVSWVFLLIVLYLLLFFPPPLRWYDNEIYFIKEENENELKKQNMTQTEEKSEKLYFALFCIIGIFLVKNIHRLLILFFQRNIIWMWLLFSNRLDRVFVFSIRTFSYHTLYHSISSTPSWIPFTPTGEEELLRPPPPSSHHLLRFQNIYTKTPHSLDHFHKYAQNTHIIFFIYLMDNSKYAIECHTFCIWDY